MAARGLLFSSLPVPAQYRGLKTIGVETMKRVEVLRANWARTIHLQHLGFEVAQK